LKIVDLTEDYKKLYCLCLEDWSDEIKEAGDHKEKWYEKMKGNGLRVKLALDENNQVGGMIQYLPVEHSIIEGKELYFIACIWVHGHKQGRGNFQKKGMGKALLQAAEEEVKQLGAKGIAAWGLSLPFWMKASWFKKHGYKKADKDSIAILLWKPFTADAIAPKWIKQKKYPETVAGKVTVTAFINGWCPVQNLMYERAKRAAAEFGDKVVFQGINTFEKEVVVEWGLSDALFINKKQLRTGPPLSYDKIKKKIARQVKKLKA